MASSNQQLQNRLVKLSVSQKESELRALQFQINPHFLYNTLSSIYWLCKLGMNNEAARAAVLLSDNFKYVIGHDDNLVTVQAELEHIAHYLELQNIRFNQSIDVIWDVDPPLKETKILKFILQPIVENAIYHGLEPKMGERRLSISVHSKGGDVVFAIEDNGIGMSNTQSVKNGYGIRNVEERIRLKYGSSYGCSFVSALGQGTTVIIRIPAYGGDNS